jgi:hypothetical protein
MTRQTKNDIAWNRLFTDYNALETINREGLFKISSRQINEEREARLMAKMDHRHSRPNIFVHNDLNILPTSRGTYIVGKFDIFTEFKVSNKKIEYVEFPEAIYTIDFSNINSEPVAINSAFISRIIADFAQTENIYPTSSGKMASGRFSFVVVDSTDREFTVCVENAQIEIDAMYESDESVLIIEAKNYIPEDFNIRQLYYPFRLWSEKLNGSKRIIPVFFSYSNGVYTFVEYEFKDINRIQSIKLVREKKYMIQSERFTLDTLIEIHKQSILVIESSQVPFPQADRIERVIDLCEILFSKGIMVDEEITNQYGFDPRQTAYYTAAARYLLLVEKSTVRSRAYFELTSFGKEIFKLPPEVRNQRIIGLILRHKVFYEVLQVHILRKSMPSREEVVSIMKRCNLPNMDSISTYKRRASTVIGWVAWIISNINE